MTKVVTAIFRVMTMIMDLVAIVHFFYASWLKYKKAYHFLSQRQFAVEFRNQEPETPHTENPEHNTLQNP